MPWRACKRRSPHEHRALKRELALLHSSLAALTPAQPARLDEPIAWAERLAAAAVGLPVPQALPAIWWPPTSPSGGSHAPSRHLDRPPVRRNGEVLILHVRRGAILMPARSAQ